MLMQPGDTITPGQQPPAPAEQPPVQAVPQQSPAPLVAPPQMTEAPAPQPARPIQEAAPAVDSNPASQPAAPVFVTNEPEFVSTVAEQDNGVVRWTASEYIDHAKGTSWFAVMGIGLFVLVVVVYFVLRDVVAPILLAVSGIAFGAFAGRKPQVLEYAVDTQGIHIGSRVYPFEDFKSFSITDHGSLPAILLTPLRRFLPPLTIFYDPKEEERILDGLANYLPYEDKEPDVVDKLMSRIRF